MSCALIAKVNVLVLRGKMPSKQPQANQTKPPEKRNKANKASFQECTTGLKLQHLQQESETSETPK